MLYSRNKCVSYDTHGDIEVSKIDPEVHRHELAKLARWPRSRRVQFPHEWQHWTVASPVTGMAFTESEAWHFIADRLEAGHRIDVVEMYDKPGTHGFVMLVEMPDHERPLYIKVQLGSGVILGRSFHWSKIDRDVVLKQRGDVL